VKPHYDDYVEALMNFDELYDLVGYHDDDEWYPHTVADYDAMYDPEDLW